MDGLGAPGMIINPLLHQQGRGDGAVPAIEGLPSHDPRHDHVPEAVMMAMVAWTGGEGAGQQKEETVIGERGGWNG